MNILGNLLQQALGPGCAPTKRNKRLMKFPYSIDGKMGDDEADVVTVCSCSTSRTTNSKADQRPPKDNSYSEGSGHSDYESYEEESSYEEKSSFQSCDVEAERQFLFSYYRDYFARKDSPQAVANAGPDEDEDSCNVSEDSVCELDSMCEPVSEQDLAALQEVIDRMRGDLGNITHSFSFKQFSASWQAKMPGVVDNKILYNCKYFKSSKSSTVWRFIAIYRIYKFLVYFVISILI